MHNGSHIRRENTIYYCLSNKVEHMHHYTQFRGACNVSILSADGANVP